MFYQGDEEKKKILDGVIARMDDKLPKARAALIKPFFQRLYGPVDLEDLKKSSEGDLFGACLSLWQMDYQRKPDEPKVRVYNPEFEQHGWQSKHTIVEIIHPDMPFLVDSVRMAINRHGLTIHLTLHMGDIQHVRNKQHQITELLKWGDKQNIPKEAIIYFEVDRQTDSKALKKLHDDIELVLKDVRDCVQDWELMREAIGYSIAELEKMKSHLDKDELQESKDFLAWLADHHFTLLGIRDYELITEGGEQVLRVVPNTGLGVLREKSDNHVSRRLNEMTMEARELILSQQILIISKTSTPSTVHRPSYTDYIGVKRFNDKGEVIGERRIIGLYTSVAYNTSPKEIPFLRRKVAQVMDYSELSPVSHAGKEFFNILVTLPRDDLFQASPKELLETVNGIYQLQERGQIRLFARRDVYGRFISCLVYVPKERFNTELRQAMQNVLAKEFNAKEITFSTRFSESVLARIHFIVRVDPSEAFELNRKTLEMKLIDVARSWPDELAELLLETYGEEQGNVYLNRYGKAFPGSYREYFSPRQAVFDVKYMASVTEGAQLGMNLYRPANETSNTFRLKLYRKNETIPLSDVIPILENMGLRIINERPFEMILPDGSRIWISDFGMQHGAKAHLNLDQVKENFQEAFANIWFKKSENDGFNQLIFLAGLNWQDVTMIRAYAKYLKQTGFTYSRVYMEQAFAAHPEITLKLAKLFHIRFSPDRPIVPEVKYNELEEEILTLLESVSSLDEDRILRRYLDLFKATLRVNFYQTKDNEFKPYFSFKLNPSAIPEMPLPLPMFEIFVYSPRFEAVHLRSNKVARGGLRWSDRPEDFRTEVLGLVKAQQVKNAVIVPAGAKGGFYPKQLPNNGDREAIMAEGVACYQDFIRGLLDLTDNYVDGTVVHPDKVVRYDEDDPYLVVAADKGTATFSDIANEISRDYHFWLGDAFASGGSAGYDHKKMGITARGAWESVKRHFYELGHNTQKEDFTVVGIGDMSGDVFGNGMLLSKHIRLVAAFNHLHIFLDPNPDAAISFKERERLFNMPRSSWSDYDPKLISAGGGVYPRSAKSIKLSPEVKELLELDIDYIVPNELIKAILKAKVDLLWNGGIGTYLKGEYERDTEVGDRANDAIRLTASEVRARVIGEGGNLGCTQQGRVEFALLGGKIFTDFIDNAGGVDCSDHEVNIKILLNAIVANGDMTEKQRNKLLAQMTDEVAELVLTNNYQQTQAISLASSQAPRNLELHSRYIKHLEGSGRLVRALEFLPDEKVLQERKLGGVGLTAPGIAVLSSYSKIILKDDILASEVPEDPYLCNILEQAFPVPLREAYREQMHKHSLKREIIATQLSNGIVNQMGFTFIYRMSNETGAPVSAIVRAYTVAREIFHHADIMHKIEALGDKIAAKTQQEMMLQHIRLLRRATRWLLRNRRGHFDIQSTIDSFSGGINELRKNFLKVLVGSELERVNDKIKTMQEKKVPVMIAKDIAITGVLLSALDIIEVSEQYGFKVLEVAKAYFAIGHKLDLGWLRNCVIAYQVENHWDAFSREALRDDLDWQQRTLTVAILSCDPSIKECEQLLGSWKKKNKELVARWQTMLGELRSSKGLNFTMLFVSIREIQDLAQTSFAQIDPSIARLCVTGPLEAGDT